MDLEHDVFNMLDFGGEQCINDNNYNKGAFPTQNNITEQKHRNYLIYLLKSSS